MEQRLHRRSTRLAALLAALTLALAACGGSEEPADTAEPVPTTEAPTEMMPTEAATTETATEMPTDMATETPTDMATEPSDAGTATAMTADDVVSALEGAGLTSLATAVEAANLGDQLANLPEFTVFAPSDEAFAAMGADVASMDVQDLQNVLTYHVTDEKLLTSDLSDGENTVNTLEGSPLTVTVDGDTVTVGDGGATIEQADVEVGENGAVHVIDQVLEPTTP
jgi:uncharacterized surface protein with fasciclin (FAS1) repeats